MKTAVEWLEERLDIDLVDNGFYFEKAKEMEKQQIIDAYDLGSLSEMQYPNPETIIENGEQYYNKTFKSE